ncbi:7TM diverse intracellular signaling domain-containing protein [Aquimarina sp. 2201CG5-10]|uniref:7TM diverse intracellular signaling domain-containing protein n=1 Tax=Aquimarina callyspongiae TaxID=3098150 RepID=UPI002AB5622E|nr:7TM diverse intracellular signaling domain-containing protein [Aquimarina sp. 2201CG5-10]MDY8138025.1 7TM diverse intracellular signaling domain-containing protein [Aquimarina sp. 2201CG5-10]
MEKSVTYLVSFRKYLLQVCIPGILMIFLIGCSTKDQEVPAIKKGTLDLTGWDFDKYPEISVQGESLFYWKQWPLDEKNNFALDLLQSVDTIVWPAALWSQKIDESKGYGTFRFFIKRKNPKKKVILNISRSLAAAEVWINGKKIISHGQISKIADNEKIDGRPLRFELPNEPNLDILLLVSNHKHRLGGGFALRTKIQETTYFNNGNKAKPLIEGIVTALVILFGIYQILHFFSFPKYSYFLYFGLYCLIGVSRQLFVGEALIYDFFPDLSFDLVQKMRYIGYYGGLTFVIMYHFYLFPGYYTLKFARFCAFIPVIGVLYVIALPVFYTTYSAPFFQVYGLFVILLGFYQMIMAVRDKKPYAKGMLISMTITCGMLANDLLNAMLVIQTEYIITYGFLFYVGFQIVLNNRIQLQTEKQLVKLSTDIESMTERISKKEEEISELRTETFQQLKSKEKLVENLKKVASNDESITIQNLIADLKSELLEDSQLTLIKNDIETLNYEFASRMKEVHPNLTKTDLEICTYLRMSLGRKEIARLRFTSLEAVKKSRSRLRKRMELSKEENLEEYIRSI